MVWLNFIDENVISYRKEKKKTFYYYGDWDWDWDWRVENIFYFLFFSFAGKKKYIYTNFMHMVCFYCNNRKQKFGNVLICWICFYFQLHINFLASKIELHIMHRPCILSRSFSPLLSSTMAARVRANKYLGLVLNEEPVHDLVELCSSQPQA